VLMARDSKRSTSILKVACIILIIGHWFDYFQMIMPGTVEHFDNWFVAVLWIEVGTFIGFAGLFAFLIFTALSKFKALAPKNHPFLQESLHHHI